METGADDSTRECIDPEAAPGRKWRATVIPPTNAGGTRVRCWWSTGWPLNMTAMRHRPFRPLLAALLALQISLAPVASIAASAMGQDTRDCEGMHSAPDAGAECPCCPEGATSMDACLAACAVQAMPISDVIPVLNEPGAVTPGFDPGPMASLSHLPPLPPPIG
jgi:hypothetical protein